MTARELADLLDVIVVKTPALQKVGVQGVEVDGIKFAIAAPMPDYAAEDDKAEEEDLPPLDDPRTFGRSRPMPKREPKS